MKMALQVQRLSCEEGPSDGSSRSPALPALGAWPPAIPPIPAGPFFSNYGPGTA
jgi:hypothetical protein